MAGVRVAGAARAVAVTGAMDFALNDDTVVTVVAVDEESEDGGEEEEDDVPGLLLVFVGIFRRNFEKMNLHDAKCPRSLEHGALTVDVPSIRVARDVEQAQVGVVRTVPVPARAVGVSDAAELVDCADESTDEEEVDESNEVGGVTCARVEE